MSTTTVNGVEFTRIANDTNGNPRYVFHFLALVTDADNQDVRDGLNRTFDLKAIAVYRARTIGGRAYNGKGYGGGIVIQSYSLDETANAIVHARKRWEVQTRIGDTWENVSTTTPDVGEPHPTTFATESDAKRDIREHLRDCREAGMKGYVKANYRAVRCEV